MRSFGSGDLRERVAFEARTQVDDGYGNSAGAWSERFQRRAGFTFLRGSEAVIASRLQGRQPVIIRVRSDSATRAITTDWQIRDLRTETAYAVRSIIQTSDRMWIDITAESGVAA